MKHKPFIIFAWLTLFVTLIVILWGDVVQATGSGDGCGAYWPVCNGEVLPAFSGKETAIEFTHRVTSGLVGLMSLALFIWARRAFEKGDLVRRSAAFTLFFMFTESLVGAGLVLFRLVGENSSMARAFVAPVHLLNTLLLIASLVLCLYFAYGGKKFSWKAQGSVAWLLGIGIFLIGLVTSTGAITSLGDAIFPVATTTEAIDRSLASDEHFLVRLRVWHPIIAVLSGAYLVIVARLIARARPSKFAYAMAVGVFVVFIAQLLAGTLNVMLKAILPTQLVHLFLSDSLWAMWVLLAVSALAVGQTKQSIAFRVSSNVNTGNATD